MLKNIQLKIEIDRIKIGANWNKIKLEWFINMICLPNNLPPSTNGWNNPLKPIIFGPKRRWTAAINFLSANVKNAIYSNSKTVNNVSMDNIFYGYFTVTLAFRAYITLTSKTNKKYIKTDIKTGANISSIKLIKGNLKYNTITKNTQIASTKCQ